MQQLCGAGSHVINITGPAVCQIAEGCDLLLQCGMGCGNEKVEVGSVSGCCESHCWMCQLLFQLYHTGSHGK